MMQVVVQKTLLTNSGNRSIPEIVSIGENAELVASNEGKVGVFFVRQYRSLLFFKRSKRHFLGYLSSEVSDIVGAALKFDVRLRTRIVDRMPAHMSEAGKETVCVSIWAEGDKWDRIKEKTRAYTPEPNEGAQDLDVT
jgi:hypothetical protein